MKKNLDPLDTKFIKYSRNINIKFARISLFVIYFWFGILKLLGLSPASPLAQALADNVVGHQYFDTLYFILAVVECLIGILFLLPRFTRLVLVIMAGHMFVVCLPLLLIPEYTWQKFMVPTLEGQYIIKNLALISVAIGIAANLKPNNKAG